MQSASCCCFVACVVFCFGVANGAVVHIDLDIARVGILFPSLGVSADRDEKFVLWFFIQLWQGKVVPSYLRTSAILFLWFVTWWQRMSSLFSKRSLLVFLSPHCPPPSLAPITKGVMGRRMQQRRPLTTRNIYLLQQPQLYQNAPLSLDYSMMWEKVKRLSHNLYFCPNMPGTKQGLKRIFFVRRGIFLCTFFIAHFMTPLSLRAKLHSLTTSPFHFGLCRPQFVTWQFRAHITSEWVHCV